MLGKWTVTDDVLNIVLCMAGCMKVRCSKRKKACISCCWLLCDKSTLLPGVCCCSSTGVGCHKALNRSRRPFHQGVGLVKRGYYTTECVVWMCAIGALDAMIAPAASNFYAGKRLTSLPVLLMGATQCCRCFRMTEPSPRGQRH
jgi:hypothetical protein